MDRQAFAARLKEFETIAEVIMLIRIKRYDKSLYGTQVIDIAMINMVLPSRFDNVLYR